jgi:hypothetical protein
MGRQLYVGWAGSLPLFHGTHGRFDCRQALSRVDGPRDRFPVHRSCRDLGVTHGLYSHLSWKSWAVASWSLVLGLVAISLPLLWLQTYETTFLSAISQAVQISW